MWSVPVDHEIFNRINSAQWMWYFHNFMKDEEETFIKERNMTEYHLSFVNPEVVQKIRKEREQIAPEEEGAFLKGVEKLFGRSIKLGDTEAIEGDLNIDLDEVNKMMKNLAYANKIDKNRNYRHWVDLDLENN